MALALAKAGSSSRAGAFTDGLFAELWVASVLIIVSEGNVPAQA